MGSADKENKGGKLVVSDHAPILVGLGANLTSPRHGPPVATLEAALKALAGRNIGVLSRSRWWESAPVPLSDQPWYVNGVAEVASSLDPQSLLALLHEIEAEFGRVRSLPDAPRVLDLDLLAYGAVVREGPAPPVLPHPRLAIRGFVLYPLADIRPNWRHPVTGHGLPQMIAKLPAVQIVRPLP